MNLPSLSSNTQAILLLTAPLIAGNGSTSSGLLSHSEYRKLARRLHEMQLQPADLLDSRVVNLSNICQGIVDESRLRRLLERGFLLSQVIERWQARAIWVISRADAHYPRRMKNHLREEAPALLYGCGQIELLETGGLAVVGSRHVDEALIESTLAVGRLTARAGKTLVSGGAKGIDQAAMRGALEAGGNAIGVLADSLEKTALKREHRKLLMDGQLVLTSPYDPSAGFNVGHAMQRNKLIYALADVSLVMSSDFNRGGTWAGATEQLEHFQLVPVYVRSSGEISEGLEALRRKGAISWPNPDNVEAFKSVLEMPISAKGAQQVGLKLPCPKDEVIPPWTSNASASSDIERAPQSSPGQPPSAMAIHENRLADELSKDEQQSKRTPYESKNVAQSEFAAGEILFATVRQLIQPLLQSPMKEADLASALQVSTLQIRAWLLRLIDEDLVTKQKKPMGYVAKQPLFRKQN
jgi:predicted Rossmann fold nucleotide-binding protein DprA/Smf involved in DNA uptake